MFEKRQMHFLLFCLNKDQFWFLLMLRTSSAEVQQKKTLQGNVNCSPRKTVIGVTIFFTKYFVRTGNPSYLGEKTEY